MKTFSIKFRFKDFYSGKVSEQVYEKRIRAWDSDHAKILFNADSAFVVESVKESL